MCTTGKAMSLSASPYSVFKAEDWMVMPTSTLGISKCGKMSTRKRKSKQNANRKKSGVTSKMESSKSHVQLAFA